MYAAHRFEGTHRTGQGLLLSNMITPGVPQLAIAKTNRRFSFRNTIRQSG
jgi:hypothetical protein